MIASMPSNTYANAINSSEFTTDLQTRLDLTTSNALNAVFSASSESQRASMTRPHHVLPYPDYS
jgi:hypothetical protein